MLQCLRKKRRIFLGKRWRFSSKNQGFTGKTWGEQTGIFCWKTEIFVMISSCWTSKVLAKCVAWGKLRKNFFEESNGIDTFPYFSSKIWGAHVLQRSVIGASRLLPLAIKTDGRSTRKTRKMVGIWPKKKRGFQAPAADLNSKISRISPLNVGVFTCFHYGIKLSGIEPGFSPWKSAQKNQVNPVICQGKSPRDGDGRHWIKWRCWSFKAILPRKIAHMVIVIDDLCIIMI